MESFRGQDVAQAFRNNHHLQQFMLTDVTLTGKALGTGSYGSVEEVSMVTADSNINEICSSTGKVPASHLCWQEDS